MHIRTTRDNLIDAQFHPAGAVLEVEDQVGQRLVKSGAAVALLPPAEPAPEVETATLKPPKHAPRKA